MPVSCGYHRAENLDGVVGESSSREGTNTQKPRRRARLVVVGIEVGGRMSVETMSFLSQLAKARSDGSNKRCE